MPKSVHIVVIAGGSGTRFWPLSRKSAPKQLLNLDGQGSLIKRTFDRVSPLAEPKHWWMVVGHHHAQACAAAVPNVLASNVLVEPSAQNTAAAIALAAIHTRRMDPEAIVVVLPADHFVRDEAAFVEALRSAVDLANDSTIVTLGIQPSRPETGYGYIQRGELLPKVSNQAFHVRRFVEKPPPHDAQMYFASGDYYWNGGIFGMRAETYLRALREFLPDTAAAFDRISQAIGTKTYQSVLEREYPTLQSISIDHGIMEKVRDVVVVPVACGWSDVGSWAEVGTVLPSDAQQNVVRGESVVIDSERCTVFGTGKHLIGVVGLSDIIVVHTEDATLVLPRERAQDVKKIVAQLEAQAKKELL